jgi:hypothetical protein
MLSMPQKQEDALVQMREVLHENYRELKVESYRLDENVADEQATILSRIRIEPGGRTIGIEGSGNGLIDAFFNAARDRFASEYPSLKNIRFTTFRARGLLREATGHAADADAEVEAGITNSYGREFTFKSRSSSLSRASIESVLAAVQYFVNAEAAYVTTWRALQHYRDAGRTDLETKYTELLSELVKNTSYSELIEEIREAHESELD